MTIWCKIQKRTSDSFCSGPVCFVDIVRKKINVEYLNDITFFCCESYFLSCFGKNTDITVYSEHAR